MNAKRRSKERQASSMCRAAEADAGPPEELLARLDAELNRLPEKYRVPVVLCELEGRSRKQVAQLLGLPEGALSWRLAHARKLLAQRLAPYGTMLSAGALAAVLTPDAACARVSPALVSATVQASLQTVTAGTVSAQVLTLTEGVVKAMFYSKLKLMGTLVLAVAVSVGAGLSYRVRAADPTRPGQAAPAARADELEELRLEVAALRKGLEAMRARVKVLENERQATWRKDVEVPHGLPTTRAEGAGTATNPYHIESTIALPFRQSHVTGLTDLPSRKSHVARVTGHPVRVYKEVKVPVEVRSYVEEVTVMDPIAEAEAALQKLRTNPNDKQAMQALANAWKKMKELTATKPAGKP